MWVIDRLYKNRNILREENLEKELILWEFILNSDKDEIKIKKFNKYKNQIKFEINLKEKKGSNSLNFDKKHLNRILETFAQRTYRLNSDHYNIKSLEEMTIDIIKDHTKELLKLPKHLQLFLCTEPNRQGADEAEQRKILNENIGNYSFLAQKPKGHWYLKDNKIEYKDKKIKKMKSIDCIISPKNIDISNLSKVDNSQKIFFGYCKVIMVAGGHQDNQLKDSIDFINQCNKYCENINNNFYFFVQSDGQEAMNKINDLTIAIKNKKKIFAGSSDKLIEWIKSKINE
jgi:hypothetical protein